MNIHIVTSSYPSHPDDPTGTAGLFVRQFALELAHGGHHVVVQPAGRKPAYAPEAGLDIDPSPWLGGDRELASMGLANPLNWIVFLHFVVCGMRKTFKINKRHSIERTLCAWALPSGLFGLFGKLLQGVPYDVWALGSDIWKIGRIPVVGRLILKIVLKHADVVYADGYHLANEVTALTGVPCRFLPSSRRLPPPNRATHPLEPGRPAHLLYVGRYHRNKGPDLLVRAVASLPPDARNSLRLEMFGFGPLREELLALVDELGLRGQVVVAGPIAAQEFSDRLDRASFLVIPSRIESIPVVLSDALQLGTPVIAMPVGDLGKIIGESGCGILAEAVTPEALAAAIGAALARGKDSFREGVAKAHARFDPACTADAWLRSGP